MPQMTKLSVLMPVYNESRTLHTIIDRVLAAPLDLEIELICVDDCSTDGSLRILQELAATDDRITVIAQPTNMGKGKAIRTAIEQMTGDVAIVQDADLEYSPEEYPKVLGPILKGEADAVYGSRFASSEVRRVLFFWHSLGNRLLTTLSNMANDLNLTDMETCYKAVRGDLLKSLRLTSDRFGIEPEITARLARSGARIYEVPISYHGRTYDEGKSIGWKDGVQALWLIVKLWLFDTRSKTDPGHMTLESLGKSKRIAQWMLEQFRPHLGKRVLEAGCGSGNLTAHILDLEELVVADIDDLHIREVRRRFGHLENVTVARGNLEEPGFYEQIEPEFDTILSVNVLEHLDRPEIAVTEFYKNLKAGGKALILVPAHDWLFSEADVALEHRRRYEAADLRALVENAGFRVADLYYFNRLGVLGWYVNKVLRRTDIRPWQARLFGLLLPVARLVEQLSFLPGLSVVAVAVKP